MFNLNIFSFVNTILFNTLYWNSLILVSIVTVKGKEYIRKIPVSERRSPIVTIPLENKCFSKSESF